MATAMVGDPLAIEIIPLECGWITLPYGDLLENEPGTIRVPVPAYLIRHPDGVVLFDSGMHPDVGVDPVKRLGRETSLVIEAPPHHSVDRQLTMHGVEASEVSFLINSHLHFDHAGGNALIPNARVIVHHDEWAAAGDPDLRARNFFNPRDFDLGHDVIQPKGEYDLFGDGRIVCIPTPGHTPGHQSLRIKTGTKDILLAGDCCYLSRSLEHRHLPPVAHDKRQMLVTLDLLQDLKDRGTTILFGHDPVQWGQVSRLVGIKPSDR
jgi:glyoxylase-like metal-dependent hydrolase (beta-lactamase superfamily II)